MKKAHLLFLPRITTLFNVVDSSAYNVYFSLNILSCSGEGE